MSLAVLQKIGLWPIGTLYSELFHNWYNVVAITSLTSLHNCFFYRHIDCRFYYSTYPVVSVLLKLQCLFMSVLFPGSLMFPGMVEERARERGYMLTSVQ